MQLAEESEDSSADSKQCLTGEVHVRPPAWASPQVFQRGTEHLDHQGATGAPRAVRLVVQHRGESRDARHGGQHRGLAGDRPCLEANLQGGRPTAIGELAQQHFALLALPEAF
eukprot:939223-Prymnesium_polylepis.2